jgi:DNA-directed RNA polymerase specialized sigma24 family protein
MSVSDMDWPASALDAADAALTALTCDPDPLTLDLDIFAPDAGLPGGVMALPALRTWLLAHPRAYPARDAVWRELVRRARLDGPQWVIAAVGMAMPALRRYAGQFCAGYTGDPDDMDAEILTGFLAALRDQVDLARDAPHAALCRAAWRAGWQLCRQGEEYLPVGDVDEVTGPRTPRVPWGHPDLLVRRAVRLGVLEPDDEQPYIDVRLGRRAIEPVAERLGITVDALRMRLGRIDTRIAQALADGLLTGVTSSQAAQCLAAQARHRSASRAGRVAAGRSRAATAGAVAVTPPPIAA